MKKTVKIALLGIASSAAVATATAQSARIARVGLVETSSGAVYSMPSTTLKVNIVVQKETIRRGPYARFAQKYLGVMAPLADKDIYTIKDASLGYSDSDIREADAAIIAPLAGAVDHFGEPVPGREFNEVRFDDRGLEPVVTERVIVSHVESDTSFVKIAPDRTEIIERSAEEMAKSAADAIFTLRKRRFELVTGEAGENVFGAGMQAALDEIARLEQEYLSLFLGKQYVQQMVREYTILPDSGKVNYIVCRFSDTAGLMAGSDLSGRPLVLELRPEGRADAKSLPRRAPRDNRPGINFRVADFVNCRLVDGTSELAARRVPIYQWGTTIDVPVGTVK